MEKEQPRRPRKPKAPFVPPTVPLWATMAIKAIAAGTATEDQQRRGLSWIVNELCGTYDWPFRPGPDQNETYIALGKQWVGKAIIKEVNISMSKLKSEGEQHG